MMAASRNEAAKLRTGSKPTSRNEREYGLPPAVSTTTKKSGKSSRVVPRCSFTEERTMPMTTRPFRVPARFERVNGVMTKGEEQLERTKRWLKRLQTINDGFQHEAATYDSVDQRALIEECRDEFLAFFMNAYHVKDWIKRGNSLRVMDAVEEYIEQTPALLIAHDLCIGAEHLSDTGTNWTGFIFKAHDHGDVVTIQVRLHIHTNKPPHGDQRPRVEALEVANECVAMWEQFFTFSEEKLTSLQTEFEIRSREKGRRG